jgi:hypothetical protein
MGAPHESLVSANPTHAAPKYVVRSCSIAATVNLLRELENAAGPWTPELRKLAVECFFGDDVSVSVFAVDTTDCFDTGNAFAVVARIIGTGDYRSELRDQIARQARDWTTTGRSSTKRPALQGNGRCTLAIPWAIFLAGNATISYSPEKNVNFTPADERHYDISFADASVIAGLLLDGLRRGDVRMAWIHREDLRSMAAIALAACNRVFGDLSTGVAPSNWRDKAKLSANEQLARLRHLAGDPWLHARPPP